MTVQKNFQKWQTEFTAKNLNKRNSGRRTSERAAENMEKVTACLEADDKKSTRNWQQKVNKEKNCEKHYEKDLWLKSYKPQVDQLLSNNYFMRRLHFYLSQRNAVCS